MSERRGTGHGGRRVKRIDKKSGNASKPSRTQTGGSPCSIPCNLCGGAFVGVLSLKDRKGAYLRTVICKKCGLIWADPRPDDDSIKDYYSKGYRREYKKITIPKKKHVYRHAGEALRRYRFFEDLIEGGTRLLDIGAGNGVFVYCLRRLGHDAQGIEPDENHSRYARKVLETPVATGFASDLEDRAVYEMITLHHVLEHMTDPLSELNHIRSMLKPEGKLVVEVPNAEDIRQDPKNRYHKAHIYTFNPETLTAMGEKAGFSLVRKSVAPLNGNIAMIFQKNDSTRHRRLNLSGNHLKIMTTLNSNTRFNHYTSLIPYTKVINHVVNAVKEQVAVIAHSNHQDIINRVVDEDRGLNENGLA